MIIRKPDYYDRFQCIAGECSDSCCIGWEIDVDEERQAKYRAVTGELGERLRTCVDWEEGHFILQGKEERCPFLNHENLCDLIIGLGEESLCEICREHPRYYEWYDGLTEAGVGLCCEAAARLILECEDKAGFMEVEEADDLQNAEEENEDAELVSVLMKARETAFSVLQDRKYSIWTRLSLFLAYAEELQDALDFGNLDEIEESAEYYRSAAFEVNESNDQGKISAYETIVSYCKKLEPIDELWPARLNDLRDHLKDASGFLEAEKKMFDVNHERNYEYEHLAVYFVYRYFMKCRTDGDVYSKGCLAVFCILLIRILDIAKYIKTGCLCKEDRVQNAKNCSKEIEYSEENLALLAEMFWEEGFEKIAVCL